MRVRMFPVAVLIAGIAGGAAGLVADEKRQLDAHEHGHGTLNIGIEGKSLVMELEVPGADIVGFEHEAKSQADKAKIDAAKKTLSVPASLFSLSDAAGCKITQANVELSGHEEHHEKGHGHDKHEHHEKEHAHHKHGHDGKGEEKHGEHTEFHVEYSFDCSNIAALGSIDFPYFDRFPNAEELDVTVITGKGQKQFEVNRENKRIDLQGMM